MDNYQLILDLINYSNANITLLNTILDIPTNFLPFGVIRKPGNPTVVDDELLNKFSSLAPLCTELMKSPPKSDAKKAEFNMKKEQTKNDFNLILNEIIQLSKEDVELNIVKQNEGKIQKVNKSVEKEVNKLIPKEQYTIEDNSPVTIGNLIDEKKK